MSVIKSVNSKTNTKSGLKGTLDYVLAEHKTSQDLCYVTGDYMELIVTPEKVLRSFMETKELYGKTDGRQCKHFVISWHEDCPIKPEEALDIAKEWAETVFGDFSCAIAVHTDRDHVHAHVVVNSVSIIDGHKYHMNPQELKNAKDFCDTLNERYGFAITEKGKHYDGTAIEEGTVRSYKKDTYQMLLAAKSKNSNLVELATAILDVKNYATSKEEFMSELSSQYGISVRWEDKRKYITFTDSKTGTKARDKNLSETFTIELSKEALLDEFKRNKKLQRKLTTEKIEIESGCNLLEERISEITGAKPSASAATTGSRRTDTGVEELLSGIQEENERADNLSKRSSRLGRRFREFLGKLRASFTGESVESLEWKGYCVAKELEERRIALVSSEYRLYTSLLPNRDHSDYFRNAIKEEYQNMLETLYWYQHTLITTDPATMIMAQTKRAEVRRETECDLLKFELAHNFNGNFDVATILKECYKKADASLVDPEKTMDTLVNEHSLEPYTPIIRNRKHIR